MSLPALYNIAFLRFLERGLTNQYEEFFYKGFVIILILDFVLLVLEEWQIVTTYFARFCQK
jgi:hypothetical protein